MKAACLLYPCCSAIPMLLQSLRGNGFRCFSMRLFHLLCLERNLCNCRIDPNRSKYQVFLLRSLSDITWQNPKDLAWWCTSAILSRAQQFSNQRLFLALVSRHVKRCQAIQFHVLSLWVRDLETRFVTQWPTAVWSMVPFNSEKISSFLDSSSELWPSTWSNN